ncbi:MAG: TOTE conflict system archaeo-eukaryotic primase domain-containing protein [Armatimonadota bacterium]
MSIPDQTEKHQCAPVDLSYRAIGKLSQPDYRLALLRTDCLLREFLHGRVKISMKGEKGRSTHPILADDVPPVLLGFTSGVFTTPPAGIRVQGPQVDPGIRHIRYYAKHHRLAIETEDIVTHTTRLAVFDFDGGPGHGEPLRDPLGAARDTIAHLRTLGWPSYLVRSNSGAGYHLYLFFQHPLPSADARRILEHVLRIDDDERARVEINPLDWDGQHGSLIHLPWWYQSKPGCNAFIDPDTETEIVLPDGGVFQRITPTQVADLLATLPTPPVEPPTASTPAARTTTAGHHAPRPRGTSSPEMETWRTQVQGDRRLIEAVYGAYLTGHDDGKWLQCRDHASPTGDRDPSAGVNIHSGVFNSHRRKRGVSIFNMMIEYGQVHTIGEAYRRAEAITGIPLPALPHTRRWRPIDQYVVPAVEATPALPEGFTLDEAREMLDEIVREEIVPRVVHRQPGAFLLRAGTGVGKSEALAALVADIADGKLTSSEGSLSALWLTDSKDNRDKLVDKYLTDKTAAGRPVKDGVVVAYARTPKTHEPGYCHRFPLTQYLAGRRQPIKETICLRCQGEETKAARKRWEALPPEVQAKKTPEDLVRPCDYLTRREQYGAARVIVGTQQSFQFGGDLIEKFNLVVVDEKAVEMFFTHCDITASDIAQWEARQEKDPELWEILKPVLSLLKQTLVIGKAEGVTIPSQGTPLIPLLRRLAPDLDDLIERLWWRFPSDRWGISTKFDRAEAKVVWQQQVAPLLILRKFVDLLVDECRRGTARDTQCWVLPPSGTEPARIHLTLIREDLLHSLQRCVVVFLDATAHVPTLQRLWRDRLRVYEIPVQAPCYTTIFADLLYRASQITEHPDRDATVLRQIHRLCAHAACPMIVGEKALIRHWKDRLPEHAKVTHWGAADMAGSNDYSDCDLFIGIGHPRGSDDDLIRQTVATRAFMGNRDPSPEGYDHFAKVRIPTPYVGYQDAEGQAWVRMVRYPVDLDACDRVLNAYAAQITQAIGRVRPANLRPFPIPVYLFTGEAPRNWRIDAMTSLDAWAPETSRHAPDANGTRLQEAGARANHRRAEETLDKYVETGRRMQAEGKRITVNSLHRECGGCKKTAQKYYPAVLQALGISAPQPFVRQAPQMDVEYPLQELYQRAHYQYPGALACWDRMTPQIVRHWWTIERFYHAFTGLRVLQPHEIADYTQALPVLQEYDQHLHEELERLDDLLQTAIPMTSDTCTEEDYWRMVEADQAQEWADECAFDDWWRTLTPVEKAALVDERSGCAA